VANIAGRQDPSYMAAFKGRFVLIVNCMLLFCVVVTADLPAVQETVFILQN